ncbi:hypothetical protein [Pontibacter chinhatensis]|uniref:Uncharacterized protein n=1 Tax=Pontibacter chinhatensis TaxID=1436961 RepID=A0A1I2M5L5_9BACT|nr:hypothetical protein [Pontibacter chinhatensis]SFF86762.1 hypothetical protein SAMN05421739_101176 [Pontibacter chinhatensis]
MKPEEIDKLFKERLGNSSPTPPADLWARLQERMEEGHEKPLVILTPEAEQKSEGKQRFMWIYSAVAATLSLLLAVGVVFYNINTGTPEISGTLTKYDNQLPETNPAAEPILLPVPESDPAEGMMAQQEPAEENAVEAEKISASQATTPIASASTLTKKPASKGTMAKVTTKATPEQRKTMDPAIEASKTDVQTAIAANITPEAPVTHPASANLNAEPVEIIIKRAVAAQTEMPVEGGQESRGDKKALAKNIFKQVRNLASGQGVELEELGIRADRVALETQIGKQKISKVINL